MERLEATVRRNASVWRQFVIYLKTKLEEWNNSLAHVIKLTFTDDVFLLYSYTSLLSEKPLLRNYAIFSNCIREACPGMTRSMLTASLSEIILKSKDRCFRRQLESQKERNFI